MSAAPLIEEPKSASPASSGFTSHIVWRATDPERTKAFLSSLLGWSCAPESGIVLSAPSGGFISLIQVDRVERGAPFLPQIPVEDLSAVLAEAQKLGDIVEEEGEIAGVARYADLRDPDGTLFSVLEFKRRSNGP